MHRLVGGAAQILTRIFDHIRLFVSLDGLHKETECQHQLAEKKSRKKATFVVRTQDVITVVTARVRANEIARSRITKKKKKKTTPAGRDSRLLWR